MSEATTSASQTVELINPWSGATVHRDITALTQAELDAYAQHMDDDLREALNSELAPCSPPEFLAARVPGRLGGARWARGSRPRHLGLLRS